MCEKCNFQEKRTGACLNNKSGNLLCPGLVYGADVRDCEFADIPPCEENSCQKCEGAPHGKAKEEMEK